MAKMASSRYEKRGLVTELEKQHGNRYKDQVDHHINRREAECKLIYYRERCMNEDDEKFRRFDFDDRRNQRHTSGSWYRAEKDDIIYENELRVMHEAGVHGMQKRKFYVCNNEQEDEEMARCGSRQRWWLANRTRTRQEEPTQSRSRHRNVYMNCLGEQEVQISDSGGVNACEYYYCEQRSSRSSFVEAPMAPIGSSFYVAPASVDCNFLCPSGTFSYVNTNDTTSICQEGRNISMDRPSVVVVQNRNSHTYRSAFCFSPSVTTERSYTRSFHAHGTNNFLGSHGCNGNGVGNDHQSTNVFGQQPPFATQATSTVIIAGPSTVNHESGGLSHQINHPLRNSSNNRLYNNCHIPLKSIDNHGLYSNNVSINDNKSVNEISRRFGNDNPVSCYSTVTSRTTGSREFMPVTGRSVAARNEHHLHPVENTGFEQSLDMRIMEDNVADSSITYYYEGQLQFSKNKHRQSRHDSCNDRLMNYYQEFCDNSYEDCSAAQRPVIWTRYECQGSKYSTGRRNMHSASVISHCDKSSYKHMKRRNIDLHSSHKHSYREHEFQFCSKRRIKHVNKNKYREDKDLSSRKRIRISKKNSRDKKKYKRKTRRSKNEIVHFDWFVNMWLNDKYKVIGKLGEGTFGRVLRCLDIQTGKEVAIKVVRDVARYTTAARVEADILQQIGKLDPNNDSRCVRMYDQFMYNGKNMCLVFEKLGLSLYDFLSQNYYRGYFMEDIQQFAKQTLQALAFLQKIKLTHTDLKPENILLECSPDDYNWVYFPRQRERCTTKRPLKASVKIIDFGSATFEDEYHCSIINTRQYRAPEVILDIGWDMSSDVWSLGCILMELYTGSLLFKTHDHLEHLAMIERIVGPFPTYILEAAMKTQGKKYIHSKEKRLDWPEGASSHSSRRRVKQCVALVDLVYPIHRPLAEFVKYLLHTDPNCRPKPSEALKHEFFKMKIPE